MPSNLTSSVQRRYSRYLRRLSRQEKLYPQLILHYSDSSESLCNFGDLRPWFWYFFLQPLFFGGSVSWIFCACLTLGHWREETSEYAPKNSLYIKRSTIIGRHAVSVLQTHWEPYILSAVSTLLTPALTTANTLPVVPPQDVVIWVSPSFTLRIIQEQLT